MTTKNFKNYNCASESSFGYKSTNLFRFTIPAAPTHPLPHSLSPRSQNKKLYKWKKSKLSKINPDT